MTNTALAERRTFRACTAETRTLEVGGVRHAYRWFGQPGDTTLLLLNRFRGTMDHWDPLLLEVLSDERYVLMFDAPGLGRSSGTAPTTLAGFGEATAAFVEGLGLVQVDVLGFSFGGMIAQQLMLARPNLLRNVILAGTGPGYVENTPTAAKVWEVAAKPVNDAEDFLYLFFRDTPTSREAGFEYLSRLELREDAFLKQVDPEGVRAQLMAAREIGTAATSLLPKLHGIKHRVLVANGNDDIMIPTYRSYAMAQAIPNAKLVIYPDSGHGFLFQHAEAFGNEVLRFLR